MKSERINAMSLKEFNAKQFLLEKGEQAGLGVALTLMVLMLILSLFMPSKGFFSGSPKTKAAELNNSTKQLEDRLATSQPGEKDLPEKREGKLIALDTQGLVPDNYATEIWFEPRMRENKARRPPKIYNVEEAIASVVAVPIDTYLIRPRANPPSIMVLQGKGGARVGGGGSGPGAQFNPFAQMSRGMAGGGGSGGRGAGRGSAMQMQQQAMLGGGNLGALNRLQGAADNTEYETRWIPLDDWSPQQLTARQLVPLRMAIIAGSFPYKKQIQEHQSRLRLKSTDEVLNETIGEKDKQTAAFDFRGVDVERREVDADGKPLSEWRDPQLKESYQTWLEHTYLPFEPENPKYESVEPNGGRGLMMPLLREFHAYKSDAPGLPGGGMGMFQRMMMGGGKGMPQQPNVARTQAPPEESKPSSRYPDLVAELPKIKETLDNIEKAQPKQIAAAHKFQKADFLNPFDANSALPADKDQNQNAGFNMPGNAGGESYIPDYVLVRVVDVTIQPGKNYQYRLKVKMANPNYHRDDVASPEYKFKETLESSDWYTLEQIVKAPPEEYYYVVDEAHGKSMREINRTIPPESAQYKMMRATAPTPTDEQVVFQFHRWVETTQQSRRDTEPIPVGEWAVADRVFVARGEYIGRKVRIDIPIWKYTQNMFILPAEEQKPTRGSRGRIPTGIDVDFGQDPPENNLILVDFEGGRVSSQTPKVDDTCAIEVLMLSPDGKLLARNSVKDTNDDQRKDRRDKVLKRIQDVREGKGTE
jgi:hypothetical protein